MKESLQDGWSRKYVQPVTVCVVTNTWTYSVPYIVPHRIYCIKTKPQQVENQQVEVFCWWSHLGSNQGPTDYESATLTN